MKIAIFDKSCTKKDVKYHTDLLLKKYPQIQIFDGISPKDYDRLIIKTALEAKDPYKEAKKILKYFHVKGPFLKTCPGSKGMACCKYMVLSPVVGCPYDCSYCFLQEFYDETILTLASNMDEMIKEVKDFLMSKKSPGRRIGTGEFSDSLALEDIYPVSTALMELFYKYPKTVLELKTKTALSLPDTGLEPVKNIVHGISVSPKPLELEEVGAATTSQRIDAAAASAKRGYMIALHFDPIIPYFGWERHYEALIEEIRQKIPAEQIAYISMGTVRFPPKMQEIVRRRIPDSLLFQGFAERGKDGKIRYSDKTRKATYQKMWNIISAYKWPSANIYLCMESADVWKNALGTLPDPNF